VKGVAKRILWISRHPPLPRQVDELKRLFGDIELWQYSEHIRDADHVLSLKQIFVADEVVAVLPLTILKHLTERGLKPIYAEMEPCEPEEADYIDPGTRKSYRFKEFKRLAGVKLELEPLEPQTPEGRAGKSRATRRSKRHRG